MTILEIIKLLIEQGHQVEYSKRRDGGYVIRKIDKQTFSAKSGNVYARTITGQTLSFARSVQLKRIRLPKGKKYTKKTELPEDLKQQLRKVQRAWRKKHPSIEGTISMRGLRYQYEHYGKEQAMASLDKSFRYTQGLAYVDNVMFLIERIQNAVDKTGSRPMAEIVELIRIKMLDFKEEWIAPVYEAYYEWANKHTIDDKECARQIRAIIS